jgi:hypothetical protein
MSSECKFFLQNVMNEVEVFYVEFMSILYVF